MSKNTKDYLNNKVERLLSVNDWVKFDDPRMEELAEEKVREGRCVKKQDLYSKRKR